MLTALSIGYSCSSDEGGGNSNPPECSITAPEDGAILDLYEDLVIKGTASDSDGSIVKVAFLFCAVLLQFLRILRPLLHGLRCHVRQQLLDHDFKFILLHDDLLVLGFVRHQPPLRQLLADFS